MFDMQLADDKILLETLWHCTAVVELVCCKETTALPHSEADV